MPKLKKYRKKENSHPLASVDAPKLRRRILRTVKAMEGFVQLSVIAMSILQITSLRFSGSIRENIRYMRTPSKEKNRKGAQLIFTSHDLSTMNSEVFRRDEIWFVAKGNSQNSKLYSLVEFKNSKGESVWKDAKFDKQYLEGKYGADPYLRRIIDWGSVNA